MWPILLAESLKALGGLGLLSLGGKYFIRRVFEVTFYILKYMLIICSINFWFGIQEKLNYHSRSLLQSQGVQRHLLRSVFLQSQGHHLSPRSWDLVIQYVLFENIS